MTKEEAVKFLNKVRGDKRRQLSGEEYNHIRLVTKMLSPLNSSNNQHTLTDRYSVAGKLYDLTYFGDELMIEEILVDCE